MPLPSGKKLGPYEIIASLGSGGMGEVYRARDTRLEREVAIKLVRERFAKDQDAVARFQREARAVAALSHPNIVTIHDFGTEKGSCYAVMELLIGQTLGKRLKESPLPWQKVVEVALAVAEGLQAAHAKGIVHRDIKPENIFLTSNDGVKILDFGLARLKTKAPVPASVMKAAPEPASKDGPISHTEPNHRDRNLVTEAGVVMGTIYYLSPEQARGMPADARSDLFSLGCVMYEMVTGRRPFQRATHADTMVAILHELPPPLCESTRDRPASLDPIINRCLEKDPDARFQSAQEVALALHNVLHAGAHSDWKTQTSVRPTETVITTPSGKHIVSASVAVLPFVNMSPDKENEYFSDGLAEELINVLSRVEGLHVASRTSAFAYKGKCEDVRKIGEQLNVASVLEGSVRKAANRLRISVQLVNAVDGYQLWSETYNRQMEDIFQVQDEIAQNIARALRVILSEKERQVLENVQPADVRAYDFYLRGMQFFHQFRRKGFEFARQMFARAIEIDPNYARAYAGLADCHSVLYTNWDNNPEHLQKADKASLKALELGPDLAETHAARGLAVMLNKRYDEAEKEFETALSFNPNSFEAYYFYAQCSVAEGKLEQAARLFELASQLRPEDYQAPLVGAAVLAGLGRKADAEANYRRGLDAAAKHLEQHPDDARAYYLGAGALTQLGQRERALDWAKKALDIDPEEPMAHYNLACMYSLQNKVEDAVTCLENAVQYGFQDKAWIEHDSDLNACRGRPRFQALLERMSNPAGQECSHV